MCPHICKIHSSVDGREGRLHVLALVTANRTAVDMGVQRSCLQFWTRWVGKDDLAPLEHRICCTVPTMWPLFYGMNPLSKVTKMPTLPYATCLMDQSPAQIGFHETCLLCIQSLGDSLCPTYSLASRLQLNI